MNRQRILSGNNLTPIEEETSNFLQTPSNPMKTFTSNSIRGMQNLDEYSFREQIMFAIVLILLGFIFFY